MKSLIRKILKEQIDVDGLTKAETAFLKFLHKASFTPTTGRSDILKYLRDRMALIGLEGFRVYELFVNNFQKDGDYDNVVSPKRIDVKNKRYVTANIRAREMVLNKIPFKGSNTAGGYRNDVYVVSSYDWYPIFVWSDGQWYENKVRYSVSTAKQMSQLRPNGEGEILSVGTDELHSIIDGKKLNEDSRVDDIGILRDFSFGVHYPFDEMEPMISWFLDEYGDHIQSQGWTIFHSDMDYPLRKYSAEKGFWQIQIIDDPDNWSSDNSTPILGIVKSDMEADVKAKELGLIVDDYGVIQGFGDRNYVDEYNG